MLDPRGVAVVRDSIEEGDGTGGNGSEGGGPRRPEFWSRLLLLIKENRLRRVSFPARDRSGCREGGLTTSSGGGGVSWTQRPTGLRDGRLEDAEARCSSWCRERPSEYLHATY